MAESQERVEPEGTSVMEEKGRRKSPRIIVQGGGYSTMLSDLTPEYLCAIKASAKAGYAVLTQQNGTAVDGVEAALLVLENNPRFNAGVGSLLNCHEEVECDAMIMDGSNLETGAVMAGRYFQNPVSFARKVMENSPHCALTADGAREFAEKNGFPILDDPMNLVTREARERAPIKNKDFKTYSKHHYSGEPVKESGNQDPHDTVSAVAMDANGNVACATSTGGIPGKLRGRVGDAALVGCGGYANEYGAATITGHGETIMKMTLAREVVYNMERGYNAQISAEKALEAMEKFGKKFGYGGIIAIDQDGNFGEAFNTKIMIWATIKDNSLQYGTEPTPFETELV